MISTLDQELGGDLMRGGVSLHPSHPPMMAEAGEDAATIYSNIRSPQYFMATSDTSDTLRPGGLADQLIETVRRRPAYTTYKHSVTCRRILTSTTSPASTASSTAATCPTPRWRPAWTPPWTTSSPSWRPTWSTTSL